MSRPFRFAVQAMDTGEAEPLRTLARRAEDLGYDELFSSDHVGLPDPFLPLMVAAEATTTLRVGPLVLNNELHHPALLARTAATIDRLSGGRLVLGLGAGYAQAEHDAIGIDLQPPGLRVERLEESVVALRALLDEGKVAFHGDHHALAVDDLGVRPAQARVPLLIGGHGRRLVEIAARHADIFQFTGLMFDSSGGVDTSGFAAPEVLKRRDWLADAAGDRLVDIERSALVQRTTVGSDTDDAIADVSRITGLNRSELADCPFVLIGPAGELAEKLWRVRDELGISHYVVRDAEAFAPVVEALRGT